MRQTNSEASLRRHLSAARTILRDAHTLADPVDLYQYVAGHLLAVCKITGETSRQIFRRLRRTRLRPMRCDEDGRWEPDPTKPPESILFWKDARYIRRAGGAAVKALLAVNRPDTAAPPKRRMSARRTRIEAALADPVRVAKLNAFGGPDAGKDGWPDTWDCTAPAEGCQCSPAMKLDCDNWHPADPSVNDLGYE